MLTWSQTYWSIIDLVVSRLFVLGAYMYGLNRINLLNQTKIESIYCRLIFIIFVEKTSLKNGRFAEKFIETLLKSQCVTACTPPDYTCLFPCIISGGSWGAPGMRTPPVQIISILCSFWHKLCKIIDFLLWEILDPPLIISLKMIENTHTYN